MNELIRDALITCLTKIQNSSELALPPLLGSTKPLDDLEGFDSEIWPIASGMLQALLSLNIPSKVNIFRNPQTKMALSIDQIVSFIAANIKAWTPVQAVPTELANQ